MKIASPIVGPNDPILITGGSGFIGPPLVASLLRHGFKNLRVLVRSSSDVSRLEAILRQEGMGARVELIRGNLLSRADCTAAARDIAVVFHLATSATKSYPDAFINSVVTTRNLLDACVQHGQLRRFVNVSSFAVYANTQRSLLVEDSPIEEDAGRCADAYTFAKVKQDELVVEYGRQFQIPYVIVRPGSVFGPGKASITGRVGVDTFGFFLHLGGSNRIPFTYVDNCADAIVLAGTKDGVNGEIFNIVDDDLPSSRRFLRDYKRNVRNFKSVYVPHPVSLTLCWLWQKYSKWSDGQLPPAFNLRRWRAEWKKTRYSNEKLKARLGWRPMVPMAEGMRRFFEDCRERRHA